MAAGERDIVAEHKTNPLHIMPTTHLFTAPRIATLRSLRVLAGVAALFFTAARAEDAVAKAPDKLVVLTFDDSVASQATIVAPLLKKFGFGATFFITEGFDFATNKKQYMTWEQIKALHDAGFEIGNHTRKHTAVNGQKPEDLAADVEYIEQQCAAHGIPRPVSFCYPAYATSPAAVEVLRGRGYRFARAGGQQAFDPAKDEPLLMPQAFDSKPGAKFEHFGAAVGMAREGKIAVLTFHGVPDEQHPWVNTDPAVFEKYLAHLKEQGCTVIAARDMLKYLPGAK